MNTRTTARTVMGAALGAALLMGGVAQAATVGVKISEWMYNPVGSPGEFVELTNFGPTAINLSGWSFDDNSRVPGSESLSAFGLVAPGESVIFTEASVGDFRTAWNLPMTVKVIGGISNNLGRSDEINIYDGSNTLIDRLTYNDQGTGIVKGPRTQGTSGRAGSDAALGANNASLWVLSSVGDIENAYKSIAFTNANFDVFAGNDIGSPGYTSYYVAPAPVPVPAAVWLLGSGMVGLLGMTRRRMA